MVDSASKCGTKKRHLCSGMPPKKHDFLANQNKELSERLSEFYQHGIKVDVTMYQPNTIQCDDTPNITADGTRIKPWKATEYRYVALSRDLLARWGGPFDYGDYIIIEGTGKWDGVYQVRDTMNKRFVNRIDILESPGVRPYKFDKASIVKTDLLVNNEILIDTY